jgi:hypothetical protein
MNSDVSYEGKRPAFKETGRRSIEVTEGLARLFGRTADCECT